MSRPPEEAYIKASEFMAATPLLHGPNHYKQWIINMDQNPLWFFYHYDCTKILAKKGQKTIQHVRKSSKDTKRATAAMTLTACGHWLPSMIIFMGRPHDMIAIRELRKNDCLSSYGRQDNTWMDKQCKMLKWTRKNIADAMVFDFGKKNRVVALWKSLFEANVKKAQNRPTTQLIEATSFVERSNTTIKAEEHC